MRKIGWVVCGMVVCGPVSVAGQFDDVPIPDEVGQFEFLIGEWAGSGRFRLPDHRAEDRTAWYRTREGGVARFDGRSWQAFAPGEHDRADSIMGLIRARGGEPNYYDWEDDRRAFWVQDGFAITVDDGRQGGATHLQFHTEESRWLMLTSHAPTNSHGEAEARLEGEQMVVRGRATDRRGERMYVTVYQIHSTDHYTSRTRVSFDDGATWIEAQMVREFRRRSES